MYPLPETQVSRCVSATLSCVSATFQSADSWHFVLCLIAEFGTDHIEKAVFVTSASIFRETVGRLKLKFDEEIEKKLIY